MSETSSKGMPGEFLLLFTLLIWLLFFLIYFGNRKNKLNFWCFAGGMCFSMGVFKEYLYHSLFPELMRSFPGLMSEGAALTIYSVLTAVPYYFAMPTVMVFGLYFCDLDQTHPKLFRILRVALYLPGLLFGLFYPFTQTRFFQLNDPVYYKLVSVYNLLYGLIVTFLMLRTLAVERRAKVRRHKLLVAALVLLPSWFTLISVLPVQLFKMEKYAKTWQWNLLVVLALIVVFLYFAFRGGAMGTILRRQTYDWSKEDRAVNQGAKMVQHAVKNEVVKIEWCAKTIDSAAAEEKPELARMILRATDNLKEYVSKAWLYSQDIAVQPQHCAIRELIELCASECAELHPGISFEVDCPAQQSLVCDRGHIAQVLANLFDNAAEAMQGRGVIRVAFKPAAKRRSACLSVSDSGPGIPEEGISHLFDPYYTTKQNSQHMGLGLYYCKNVLARHGGSIAVKRSSQDGGGASFLLYFPEKGSRGRGEEYERHSCARRGG